MVSLTALSNLYTSGVFRAVHRFQPPVHKLIRNYRMEICVPEQELRSLIDTADQDKIARRVIGVFVERKAEGGKRVLVVKRAADEKFLPNLEELPSGGVEPNETLVQAIERETREETGLRVSKILKYICQFDYKSRKGYPTRQFNFSVEVNGGQEVRDEDIKLNPSEHSSFCWLAKEDVDGLNPEDPGRSTMINCLKNYFSLKD